MQEVTRIKDTLQVINEKLIQCVTIDDFKPVAHDVKSLKENMTNAMHDIDQLWKELNKLKEKFDGLFFPSMEDFNALKQRVEKLESGLAALKKAYGDLEKELKKLK